MKYFYQMEREATVLLVGSLLRAAGNESNQNYSKAHEYVKRLLDIQPLFYNLALAQYQKVATLSVPKALEHKSEDAALWAFHNLNEQRNLLEIQLLAYYEIVPCNAAQAVKVMKVLLELGLGSNQINRPFFDRSCNEVHNSIRAIATTLSVELLNFETLHGLTYSGLLNLEKQALVSSPESLEEMNTMIWKHMVSTKQGDDIGGIGVLAMAWACFCQYLVIIFSNECPPAYHRFFRQQSANDSDEQSPQLLFQFGYSDARGIDFLNQMFDSHSSIVGDSNEIAYKSIMKGFWNILLTTQQVSTLPDRPKLIDLFVSIVQNSAELALQFWEEDFHAEECRSLLDASSRSFPIDVHGICKLVGSLISDAATANYSLQYFKKMQTFADYVRTSDYELSFDSPSNEVLVWNGKSLIANAVAFPLNAPPGTLGYVVGQNVILLNFQYSAWHVCQSILESFLRTSEAGMNDAAHILVGTSENCLQILTIINKFLVCADLEGREEFFAHLQIGQPSKHHFGDCSPQILATIICHILNKCCEMQMPETKLITCCMETLRILLSHYPLMVWSHLRGLRLIPQDDESGGAGVSYIRQVVIPNECQTGGYPATLGFLDLLCELAKESQLVGHVTSKDDMTKNICQENDSIKTDILFACISYVLVELFPVYKTWRYVYLSDKFRIGKKILKVFNIIMHDTTWFKEGQCVSDVAVRRVGSIQNLLLEKFAVRGSILQIAPLLDIISLGNDIPLNYHKIQKRNEALLLEESILSAMKLLKALLKRLVFVDNGVTPLENALLDRSIKTSSGKHVELIQTIAGYINYEYNKEFALVATAILTLMCKLSIMPNRPSVSFIGYFGAEAFSLASNFVTLVDDDSLATASDPALQMSIFNFVKTVIMNQPGLGAMFLSGSASQVFNTENDQKDLDKIPESSILHPLIGAIKRWDTLRVTKPAVLASCLDLLDSLWQTGNEHQSTLGKLRKCAEVWEALIAIVGYESGAGEDVRTSELCYLQLSQAHAIRILASEAYLLSGSSVEGHQAQFGKICKALINVILPTNSSDKDHILQSSKRFVYNPDIAAEITELSKLIYPEVDMAFYQAIIWNNPYSVSHMYGNNFVFDVNLYLEKFSGSIFGDDKALSVCEQMVAALANFNINWSRTDAYLALISSHAFAMDIFVKTLWIKMREKGVQDVSEEQILLSIVNIASLLKEHRDVRPMYISYKTELSRLIFFMLGHWLPSAKAKYGKDLTKKVIPLLESLCESLMLQNCPLGPVGTLSQFTFHQNIFASVLIILQNLPDNDVAPSELDAALAEISPAVCEGLYYLLSAESNAEDLENETILLAIICEITKLKLHISVSIWSQPLERYQTIPLLLKRYVRWQISSNMREDAGNSPEQILEVILCLSSHHASAHSLYANGVMSALCNNALSQELANGNIASYQGNGRVFYHKIWCLMIAIVTQLVGFLGSRSEVLEYAVGFIRLYQKQCMNGLEYRDHISISLGGLEEHERLTQLFYTVIRSSSNADIYGNLILDCQDKLLNTLALFSFLIKSPHQLQTRIESLSREQKGSEMSSDNYRGVLDVKIGCIIRNIMMFLCLSSKAESNLDMDTAGSTSENTLILQQTMTSFEDQSASFGTLFDISRYAMQGIRDCIEKPAPQSKEHLERFIMIAETDLTLIGSQISTLSLSEDDMPDIRKELSSEFSQTLVELKGVLGNAGKKFGISPAIEEANAFLNFFAGVWARQE